MNTLINLVQLVGRLGTDVELKTLQNGSKVVNISLATNEYSKNNKSEWVETTYWHRLVFWGTLAERLVEKARKGSRLFIQGTLTYHQYLGAMHEKKEMAEIVIRQFVVLDHTQTVILNEQAVATEIDPDHSNA